VFPEKVPDGLLFRVSTHTSKSEILAELTLPQDLLSFPLPHSSAPSLSRQGGHRAAGHPPRATAHCTETRAASAPTSGFRERRDKAPAATGKFIV